MTWTEELGTRERMSFYHCCTLHLCNTLKIHFCLYLHQTEDVEYVVESQDAVIDGHQTTEPGGGGYQQQQEGISNSATGERKRERFP